MLIIKEGRATLTEEAVTYKKHADGTYYGHLYMQHGQLYTGQKRHGNYSCYKQHGQRKHGTNLSTCTGTMARGSIEPICPLVQAAWPEEAWNQSVHLYMQAALPEEAWNQSVHLIVQAAWPEEAWKQSVHLYMQAALPEEA